MILNYLRSGAIEEPAPPLTLEGAINEAEFFNVWGLANALRQIAEPPSVYAGAGKYGSGAQILRADGSGIYVWSNDSLHPGNVEAICFERTGQGVADFGGTEPVADGDAAAADFFASSATPTLVGGPGAAELHDGASSSAAAASSTGNHHERGTLIYSRGPCARENLLAVRSMPRPLPRVWRESADASTIVAFFTQRFLSRGIYEREGSTILMSRGSLGDATPPGATPSSTVATVGVLLPNGDLLLLGPDGASDARTVPLLEQLGLAAGARSTTESGVGGGLGGGFKRFSFEGLT